MSCFIENKMVSVERIKQFTTIPSEAEWRIKDCLPVANWPTIGDIDVIDLKVNSSCALYDLVLVEVYK
jgi:ATP-binding cassette subfamily C (CFTR/MRP) protein 1